MEFSTLNGYKVKDKKATRFYDNVESMKNDTTLKEGMHVKTSGYYSASDGGHGEYVIVNDDSLEADDGFVHTLNNDLKAKLIIENDTINIKQFGIVDNTTDSGSVINKITNDLNYKVYVPKGDYLVEETINPSGSKILIIDGNLTYTGNDSCIKIDSPRNYVKTKNITTTNGVCVLLENDDSSTTKCEYNKLYFDGVLSSTNNHAMYLHAILRGIVYNEIHFDTLSSANDKYSLYIKTESSGSVAKYVNENTFYGGRCSKGLYGIYIDTTTSGSTGECNGLKFYNIALEGVTNGIYLNNARACNFISPRVAELTGHYVKFVGNCDGNYFNFLSLIQASKFDVSEINTNKANNNFINGEIATSTGTRFARNFIASGGKLPIERLLNKIVKINITNGLITEGTDDNPNTFVYGNDNFQNYLLMNSTLDPNITLNGYFGSKGINEIFIEEGGVSKPFRLYDSYGSVIEDYSSPTTTGVKHFVCMDVNSVDTWIQV